MQYPPSRQSDPPSTIEINDPTSNNIGQNEHGHSRCGKYNLGSNPNLNNSEIERDWCVQKIISAPAISFLYF